MEVFNIKWHNNSRNSIGVMLFWFSDQIIIQNISKQNSIIEKSILQIKLHKVKLHNKFHNNYQIYDIK